MLKWFGDLDRILRGEATRLPDLRSGTIRISARGMTVVIILLGMFYGVCMGCYAIVSKQAGLWQQALMSLWKVPALFLMTLVVTFPSLYVFNALLGSRLTLVTLLRLLIAALSVMLALLASFGTIVAFFSFTTDSYPFMVILNVVVYAFCGFLGLSFLLQTLHRLTIAPAAGSTAALPVPKPAPPVLDYHNPAQATGEPLPEAKRFETKPAPGPLDTADDRIVGQNVRLVFRIWILVFGLVGAQMSWVLRPFIGSQKEFVAFRPRGSNFFEAVFVHLKHLMGGW